MVSHEKYNLTVTLYPGDDFSGMGTNNDLLRKFWHRDPLANRMDNYERNEYMGAFDRFTFFGVFRCIGWHQYSCYKWFNTKYLLFNLFQQSVHDRLYRYYGSLGSTKDKYIFKSGVF